METPKRGAPMNRGMVVSSRVVAEAELDRSRRIHRTKLRKGVRNIGVDNSPPRVYKHLQNNSKAKQARKERAKQIEHENRILLGRMTEIGTRSARPWASGRKGKPSKPTRSGLAPGMRLDSGGRPILDHFNDGPVLPSLNYETRRDESERIQSENMRMLHRLTHVRGTFPSREIRQHEVETERRLEMLRRSPRREPGTMRPTRPRGLGGQRGGRAGRHVRKSDAGKETKEEEESMGVVGKEPMEVAVSVLRVEGVEEEVDQAFVSVRVTSDVDTEGASAVSTGYKSGDGAVRFTSDVVVQCLDGGVAHVIGRVEAGLGSSGGFVASFEPEEILEGTPVEAGIPYGTQGVVFLKVVKVKAASDLLGGEEAIKETAAAAEEEEEEEEEVEEEARLKEGNVWIRNIRIKGMDHEEGEYMRVRMRRDADGAVWTETKEVQTYSDAVWNETEVGIQGLVRDGGEEKGGEAMSRIVGDVIARGGNKGERVIGALVLDLKDHARALNDGAWTSMATVLSDPHSKRPTGAVMLEAKLVAGPPALAAPSPSQNEVRGVERLDGSSVPSDDDTVGDVVVWSLHLRTNEANEYSARLSFVGNHDHEQTSEVSYPTKKSSQNPRWDGPKWLKGRVTIGPNAKVRLQITTKDGQTSEATAPLPAHALQNARQGLWTHCRCLVHHDDKELGQAAVLLRWVAAPSSDDDENASDDNINDLNSTVDASQANLSFAPSPTKDDSDARFHSPQATPSEPLHHTNIGSVKIRNVQVTTTAEASHYVRLWVVGKDRKQLPEVRTDVASKASSNEWAGPWSPEGKIGLTEEDSCVEVTVMGKRRLFVDEMIGFGTVSLRWVLSQLAHGNWTTVRTEIATEDGTKTGSVQLDLCWTEDEDADAEKQLQQEQEMQRRLADARAATFGRSEFVAAMRKQGGEEGERKVNPNAKSGCLAVRDVAVRGLPSSGVGMPLVTLRFEGDNLEGSGPTVTTPATDKVEGGRAQWMDTWTPADEFLLGLGSSVTGTLWNKKEGQADERVGRFRADVGGNLTALRSGRWVKVTAPLHSTYSDVVIEFTVMWRPHGEEDELRTTDQPGFVWFRSLRLRMRDSRPKSYGVRTDFVGQDGQRLARVVEQHSTTESSRPRWEGPFRSVDRARLGSNSSIVIRATDVDTGDAVANGTLSLLDQDLVAQLRRGDWIRCKCPMQSDGIDRGVAVFQMRWSELEHSKASAEPENDVDSDVEDAAAAGATNPGTEDEAASPSADTPGSVEIRNVTVHSDDPASHYVRMWIVGKGRVHLPEIRTEVANKASTNQWAGPWNPEGEIGLGEDARVEVTVLGKRRVVMDDLVGFSTIPLEEILGTLADGTYTTLERPLVDEAGATKGWIRMEIKWKATSEEAPPPSAAVRKLADARAATFGRSEFVAAMRSAQLRGHDPKASGGRLAVRDVSLVGLSESATQPMVTLRFEGDDVDGLGPTVTTGTTIPRHGEAEWPGTWSPKTPFVLGLGSSVTGTVWTKNQGQADERIGRFRADVGANLTALRSGRWIKVTVPVQGSGSDVSMVLVFSVKWLPEGQDLAPSPSGFVWARDLRIQLGTPRDVYARVRFVSDDGTWLPEIRSATAKKATIARWHEMWHPEGSRITIGPGTKVEVTVVDDRTGSSIGSATMPLADLQSELVGGKKWVTVRKSLQSTDPAEKSETIGDVSVGVRWSETEETPAVTSASVARGLENAAGKVSVRDLTVTTIDKEATSYVRMWIVGNDRVHLPEVRTPVGARSKTTHFEGPWTPEGSISIGPNARIEVTAMGKRRIVIDDLLGFCSIPLGDYVESLQTGVWVPVEREFSGENGAVSGSIKFDIRWEPTDGETAALASRTLADARSATFGRSEFVSVLQKESSTSAPSATTKLVLRNVVLTDLPPTATSPMVTFRFEGDDETSTGPTITTEVSTSVRDGRVQWDKSWNPSTPFGAGLGATVSGTVWNKKTTGADDRIGRFRTDLSRLRPNGDWNEKSTQIFGASPTTRISFSVKLQ